jgi:hypothetical protein
MTANSSRRNERQVGPGVNDLTNRYNENIYEAELARPARNRLGERGGERQAEEGLWRDPRYSSSFVGGVAVEHGVYEVAQAPGIRGSLASGQAIPAWNAVPLEALANFADAMDFGDPGQATPFRGHIRVGAQNPNALTPLDGLMRGSRQNTRYVSVRAGQADGRIARHNQAEIDR